MSKEKNSAFFIYQLVCLLLLAYLLVLPLLVPYIRMVAPDFWQCSHYAQYGEPCPFCGTTTHVYRLLTKGVVPPTYICISLVCFLFEIVRKIALCMVLMLGKQVKRATIWVDGALTATVLITVTCCFLLR